MTINKLLHLFNNNYKIKFSSLFFELTNKCNLNCIHCYNNSGNNKDSKELDISIIKQIIKNIKIFGCKNIILSGGEVFLYTKIKELILYLKKENFNILIITNSILLNENYIEFLKKNDVDIQISLDGYNKKTNDFIRQNGSFEHVIRALNRLNQANYTHKTSINVVLNKYNCDNLAEYYKISEKYNIDNLYFNLINNIGRAYLNKLDIDCAQFLKIVKEQQLLNSKIKLQPSFNCRLNNLYSKAYLLNPVISYNGDVYLCEKLRNENHSIGNIYNSTLKDIFYSDNFKYIIAQIHLRTEFIDCTNCVLNTMCECGCPAEVENLFELGNCEKKILWFKENVRRII